MSNFVIVSNVMICSHSTRAAVPGGDIAILETSTSRCRARLVRDQYVSNLTTLPLNDDDDDDDDDDESNLPMLATERTRGRRSCAVSRCRRGVVKQSRCHVARMARC